MDKDKKIHCEYDVIVIGGGPGGYVAAIKAAQQGKKVCLVEEATVGGTCLNVGCIPTKTLIKTANLYSQIKEVEKFAIEGLSPDMFNVSMLKLQARKKEIIKQLVGGIGFLLQSNKVKTIAGHACFENSNSIIVNGEVITSEYFIIATGSRSFIPPFIDMGKTAEVMTSTEALNVDHVPDSIVIIGGGVIGIEFAYLFHKLGSKVTVLELMDNILPMVDEEVSDLVKRNLERQGVTIITGAKVEKIEGNTLSYQLYEGNNTVDADTFLVSVGRLPNTEGLNAEMLGLKMEKGAIGTDCGLRTNIENIYAIGDVNGKSMLAHTAEHEGIIAVENILGGKEEINYEHIPSCIYLEPEVASIGMTEAQAREAYGDIRIGRFLMAANAKSLVECDSEGMIKVILDQHGKIIGAHLFCQHATDMIAEVSTAMTLGANARDIIKAVHPHPTVSEAIPEAFMSALSGKAIHSY